MGIRRPDPNEDLETALQSPDYESALAQYEATSPPATEATVQRALQLQQAERAAALMRTGAAGVDLTPMAGNPNVWREMDAAMNAPAPVPASPSLSKVVEKDDRFEVTQGGQTFQVLKDGLKADTLAHLQGIAHAHELAEEAARPPAPRPVAPGPRMMTEEIPQTFADGGVVQDAGYGQTLFTPLAPMSMLDAGAGAPIQFTPGGAIEPSLWEQLNGAPPAVEQLWAVPQAIGQAVGNAPDALREVILGPLGNAISKDATAAAALQQGQPVRSGTLPPVPAPTAPSPAQPPMAMPSLPGVPSQVGELNRGLAEQRAALEAQVQAQREQDLAIVGLQDQHIAKLQALEAAHQEQAALIQRRADDLFQATLNAQIDPNRVWAQADMGQRVGAGIALILGGIGAGLGGGPNLALQQINRIIDMDVDAQKSNLEKQQTLLGHYLQQGRDMRAAHQLAKADLQDLVAAQMLRVSASFGGDKAAAAAQLAAGELRTNAAGMRSQMLNQDYQRSVQRAQMQSQMEMNRLLMGVVNAPRTPAGGVQAPAQVLEMLPKDMRERAVYLPDNSITFAPNAARAQKIQEGLQKADSFQRTLARYSQLLKSGNPVLPTVLGGDRSMAASTRSALILQLKELENLGVLNGPDVEILTPMVPDITAFFTSDKTLEQGLQALQNRLGDMVLSNVRAVGGAR